MDFPNISDKGKVPTTKSLIARVLTPIVQSERDIEKNNYEEYSVETEKTLRPFFRPENENDKRCKYGQSQGGQNEGIERRRTRVLNGDIRRSYSIHREKQQGTRKRITEKIEKGWP